MYHSIDFYSTVTRVTKNTWDDFHLIPTSRPLINSPTVKKKTVELPGANGILDLTTSLTGYPLYNNREGSLEFIVANGYEDWVVLYSKLMNFFNGTNFKIMLEDDPYCYYEGTCNISGWTSNPDGTWSNVTIDYSVNPYKYDRYLTAIPGLNNFALTEDCSWSTDRITDYVGYAPTYPVLTLDGSMGAWFELTYYNELTNKTIGERITGLGTHKLTNMEFLPANGYDYIFTFGPISENETINITMEVQKGGL